MPNGWWCPSRPRRYGLNGCVGSRWRVTCVRWYVAHPLSLRHLEEMMAERGVSVDHATVHRWATKIVPVLAAVFRRRKRPVGKSWRMDETYIKVHRQWK